MRRGIGRHGTASNAPLKSSSRDPRSASISSACRPVLRSHVWRDGKAWRVRKPERHPQRAKHTSESLSWRLNACAAPPDLRVDPPRCQFATLRTASAPTGHQVSHDAVADGRGAEFRDLNRNGTLEPYEDWRLAPPSERPIWSSRMTLEEKAGAAVHGTAPAPGNPMGAGTSYDTASAAASILTTTCEQHDHAPVRSTAGEFATAEQRAAGHRRTRPARHSAHDQHRSAQPLSGRRRRELDRRRLFAVARDTGLRGTRRSRPGASASRASSEPSIAPSASTWPCRRRQTSRPNHAGHASPAPSANHRRALVRWSTAYVQGMQGNATRLTRDGVATVVKHWVGYGASVNGFDGHNYVRAIRAISRRPIRRSREAVPRGLRIWRGRRHANLQYP